MHELLSIIVPAYNEASRIPESLAEIVDFARAYPQSAEIVVVDDGSTDNTATLAEAFMAPLNEEARRLGRRPLLRLVRHAANRGKGAAVRTGFSHAAGDIVLFTDADLSTPMSEAPRLIQPIADNECDIAIGSRALDRSLIEARQSLFRENAGRVFNWMVRRLSGLPFWDTQCGFKAFRRETTARAFELQKIDGFAFDVELLYLAARLGLCIRELPVRWGHAHGSKVSMFHHTREMAIDLCRVLWNDWRGRYPLPDKRSHT
jgi:dolichyl-phosphate beta-glucosyltransferase